MRRKRAKIDDVGDALSRAVARVMGLPVAPQEKPRPKMYGQGRRFSTAHRNAGGWNGCLDDGVRAMEDNA